MFFVLREVGEYYLFIRWKKDNSFVVGSLFFILVELEEFVEGVGCFVDYCFKLDDVNFLEDIEKNRLKGILKRLFSDREELIELKFNLDNIFSCLFVLCEIGFYYINIKKYGRYVEGSLFVVKVIVLEGVFSVGKFYGKGFESFDIDLLKDYFWLSVVLKRFFSFREEEFKFVFNGDNILGVVFIFREEGEYLIYFRKDNKDV